MGANDALRTARASAGLLLCVMNAQAQRSAVQHYHDFTMANGLHLPDPGAPASPPIASFAARARCSVVGAWILCQRLNDDDLEEAVRCPFRSILHLLTLKVRQL